MSDPILSRRIQRYQTAIDEAERFLGRAKPALKMMRAWEESPCFDTKLTSGTKRASMDLSRALSDIRRNPYND